MMRTMLIWGIAVTLAACGKAPEREAAKAPEPPSAFQNSVAALAEPERNIVFIRAIRDADRDCQGVTKSERRGTGTRGDPLYVATCNDGASYGVLIGRNGTAQVVGAPRP